MNPFRVLSCVTFASMLTACTAVQSIVPQQSTLAEVRDRMGRPTDIRFDREGNELWEYATGPMGTETYLIHATLDGRVVAVSQLITPEQFARIERGVTTKAQVRELLGMPSEIQYLGGSPVWSWRMRIDPQRGYYSVRFDPNGVAVETLVIMDPSGDDRDRERGRGGRGGGGERGGGGGRR